jgi:uncharacterized protein (TIGR02145 family)
MVYLLSFVELKNNNFFDKRNNKIYPFVQIDTLVWMLKNLNADKFRNVDPIPDSKTLDELKKACKNVESE